MEPTHENAAFLAEAINRAYGPDDARAIALGFAEAEGRPVTLRANALKTSRDDVARALKAAGIAFEGVAWFGDAFVCRDVREHWFYRYLARYGRDVGALPQTLPET